MKKNSLILALASIGGALAPCVASAGEIDDLKAGMQRMQARLEQLEASRNAAPTTNLTAADVVTRGSMPGSFKLPGSDTSVKFGGYVQVDGIYDIKGNQGRYVSAGEIPLRGSADSKRNGTTTFSARTSRVNMETHTPSKIGDIQTRIEFDFATSEGGEGWSNSARPRLRHAYGTVGNWLVGQAWSNFMDLDSMPDTIEFNGASGQTLIRQPQVRYTAVLNPNNTISISVENPESDVRVASGSYTAIDRGPDFTAKWKHSGNYGHFAARALVRSLRVDNGSGEQVATDMGWGLGVGGSLKLGANDTILYQLNGGEGAGRYIQDIYGAAAYDASRSVLASQKAIGGYVALQHLWSPDLRSTLSLSGTNASNKSGFGPVADLNKSTREVHANLIWKAAPQIDVGVEYVWAKREVESGAQGIANRIQGMAKYSF